MLNDRVGRFAYIENENPALIAGLGGSAQYPAVHGTAFVYWLPVGFYIVLELRGLPPSQVFGLHIHDGTVCEPLDGEAFSHPTLGAQAGRHLNNCGDGLWSSRHPYHAGDLPPVFSNAEGEAVMQIYIDRAALDEVAGKPLVLHRMPDDFKTQPAPDARAAGGSGIRIACGVLAQNI